MKLIKSLGLLFVGVLIFAFSAIEPADVAGKYGDSTTESKVELNLLKDGSFTYVDKSNSEKEIAVKGNWELNKNTISLTGFEATKDIHTSWKLEKDGTAIKSKKGLTYYRLANGKSCAPKACCSKDKAKSCSEKK